MAYDLETKENSVILVSYVILDYQLNSLTSHERFYDAAIEGVKYSRDFNKFISLVKTLTLHSDVVLVAHNGHKFDHFFVYDALDIPCAADVETFKLAELSINNHVITFADTWCWFTMKLADLGKLVGLPKLVELAIDDPIYCCRDTAIVVAALHLIRDAILPVCKIDLPYYCFYGVADVTYRYVHSFLDNSQHLNWSYSLWTVLSQCYYGGRVDSCMYGMHLNEEISCLDITSMYPSSLTRSLPAGNLSIVRGAPPPDKHSICCVTLHKDKRSCQSACFGILPVHMKTCIAFFDYGTFDGWYTSVDIAAFIDDGWLVQYHVCYVFDGSCTLAPIYLDLYAKRKHPETTKNMDYAYKIAMNSSYGKFVQKHRGGDWLSRLPYIGWWCTAHTRRQLLHLKQMASNTVILYNDTDSIFVLTRDVADMRRRCPQYFVKALATEGITVADEGSQTGLTVMGKKSYVWGKKIKFKGFEKPKRDDDASMATEIQYALFGETATNSREGIPVKRIRNGLSFIDRFKTLTRNANVNIPVYKDLCNKCGLYH